MQAVQKNLTTGNNNDYNSGANEAFDKTNGNSEDNINTQLKLLKNLLKVNE